MIMKLLRVSRMVVLIVFVLCTLTGEPGFVASQAVAATRKAFRDAKARQNADRCVTEIQRQQVLASTAEKFDERERRYGKDDYYAWDRRYGNSASNRRSRNYVSNPHRHRNPQFSHDRQYENKYDSTQYVNRYNRYYCNTAKYHYYGNTAINHHDDAANNRYSNAASKRQYANL